MRTALVDREIDVAALVREVADARNGATLLFVGTVRDVNDGRAVTGMEYSAYRYMAERELADIVREASEEFGTTLSVVEHRLGTLALGDASVAIAVAHPHRGAAYDASRYVIEQLKRRVPIWKLEHYVDGTREWVDPTKSGVPAASAGAAHG
jgi:molybdopterin synthase catalytic subunit